ncbi:unnamed protein product [Cyprideis torosa]|uniref:Uncharacterized protein n=1 Tax=Cyprideis torosa TaxID=163714 RepID=A0A7R8ZNI0_9CRUS|nr:unnamed protein product [Cyprideis torosa]CAG0887842.1 unnamed protein product [Cyprideis torosa]
MLWISTERCFISALREAVCPEGYVLRDGICTTVKIVRPTVSVFIVRPRILTFLLDSFKGFGGSDLLPYGSSRLPSQGFISAAEFEPRDKTESDKHNEPKKSEREENILEIKINQDGDMTIIRTETNKNPSDDEPTNSSDEPINAAEEQSTINTVEHNEEEPVNKVEQEKLINIAEEQGTINAAGEEEPINEEDDTKNTTEQEESINKGDDTKNTAEQEESINEDYDTKNTAEQEESINEDEEQGTINMAASQEKPDPAAGEENVKIDEQDPLENAIDETPIKMTIFEIDAEDFLCDDLEDISSSEEDDPLTAAELVTHTSDGFKHTLSFPTTIYSGTGQGDVSKAGDPGISRGAGACAFGFSDQTNRAESLEDIAGGDRVLEEISLSHFHVTRNTTGPSVADSEADGMSSKIEAQSAWTRELFDALVPPPGRDSLSPPEPLHRSPSDSSSSSSSEFGDTLFPRRRDDLAYLTEDAVNVNPHPSLNSNGGQTASWWMEGDALEREFRRAYPSLASTMTFDGGGNYLFELFNRRFDRSLHDLRSEALRTLEEDMARGRYDTEEGQFIQVLHVTPAEFHNARERVGATVELTGLSSGGGAEDALLATCSPGVSAAPPAIAGGCPTRENSLVVNRSTSTNNG